MTDQSIIKENYFNILIVDDIVDIHPITRNVFFNENISGKPLHFISAYNEEEAQGILKKYHRGIAVVILDLIMIEEYGGLKVIEYLRTKLNNSILQIIIRSAYSSQFPKREIMDMHSIHDYIEKGDTSDDKLYISVRSAIRTFIALQENTNVIENLEHEVNERTTELHERTTELKQIFNVSTPLIQIDAHHKILNVNDSFKELFQIQNKDLINETCYETLDCKMKGETGCSLHILRKGKLIKSTYEDSKILPDGTELLYRVNATPIKDEDGNITSIVENIVDITELKNLAKQAEKENKLKGEFLSQVSHDVRTPINSILLNAIIAKNKSINDELTIYLDSISKSSNVLLDFIEDILTYYRLEKNKLELDIEPTDILTINKEIDYLFRSPIEYSGKKFNCTIEDNLPDSLLLDGKRVRQILINLISNAQKYTDSDGVIEFTLSTQNKTDSTLDLIFKIKDNGIGIPKDKQDIIFKEFQVIQKKRSKGIGLGLSIVKKLVDKMHGEILLESESGKGSTFIVIIKNIEISSEKPKVHRTQEYDRIKFEKGTLLIADDTFDVRQSIINLFIGTDIHVIEAANTNETFEKIKHYMPNMVLMDIKFPNVNEGVEITKKLRSVNELKNIPIYAYTASVRIKEIKEDIKLFNGYISKTNRDIAGKILNELKKYVHYKVLDSNKSLINKISDIPERLKANLLFKQEIERLKKNWERQNLHISFNKQKVIEFSSSVVLIGDKFGFECLKRYGGLFDSTDSMKSLDHYRNFVKEFPEIINIILSKLN